MEIPANGQKTSYIFQPAHEITPFTNTGLSDFIVRIPAVHAKKQIPDGYLLIPLCLIRLRQRDPPGLVFIFTFGEN